MNWFDEPKVRVWKENIERSGCIINRIEPLSLVHKTNGDLLFALCKTDISNSQGGNLPSMVLIRGDAVVIVPLVKNLSTGENRFITVVQHRIGTGEAVIEFPAGMLDKNIDNPAQVAVEELLEETGINISGTDLFKLSEKVLYSSPGLQDEGIHYFGCVLEMSDSEYKSIEGRVAGNFSEGESILVSLKTEDEIINSANSTQVILGLFLFKKKHALL
jgi:8-oxo-dGTP pyrophosphatase MutT (NUDIX family)